MTTNSCFNSVFVVWEKKWGKPLLDRSYHYPHKYLDVLQNCIKRFNCTKYSHHRKTILFFWLLNSNVISDCMIRPELSSYCIFGLKILSTIKPDPRVCKQFFQYSDDKFFHNCAPSFIIIFFS